MPTLVSTLADTVTVPVTDRPHELTVMITVEFAESVPATTVSCTVYVPAVEKLAVVVIAAGLLKVTVPGPFATVQLTNGVHPGKQLPLALPARVADDGNEIV